MNQATCRSSSMQEPDEDSVDSEVRLFMVGESGVIAKRALGTQERRDESSSESPRDEGVSVSGKVVRGLQGEVATLMEQLKAEKDRADKAENELASLRAEADAADRLKIELRREKEKYKQVWRMNCEQQAEYDAATTAIDEEMAALREQPSSGGTGGENHSWTRNRGGRSSGRSRDCWYSNGCHGDRGIWGETRVVSRVAEERESPTGRLFHWGGS